MLFNYELYNRESDLLYSYKIFNDTVSIIKKKRSSNLVFKVVLNNDSQKNALAISDLILVRKFNNHIYDKRSKEQLEKLKDSIIDLLILNKFGSICEEEHKKLYRIFEDNTLLTYSFI